MGFDSNQYEDAEIAAQGRGFSPSFSTPMQRGTSPLECWYSGVINQTAYTTGSNTIDTLFAQRIVIGRSGILDRIAFEQTAAGGAGSLTRCGLYAATSRYNIYPSSLVVDGGEIATDGANATKVTTISTFVQAGLYWLVVLSGVSAPTLRARSVGGQDAIGGVPSTIGTTPNSALAVALAYQALPATFPAGAGFSGTRALVHIRLVS
jgi:hypothetical protein